MSTTTIVSAPGKVLAAGGYLVLDQQYPGVVISTSSRFYTVIQASSGSANQIVVRSPQFHQAEWRYTVTYNAGGIQVNPQEDSIGGKNKFVHLALQHTLNLVSEIHSVAQVQERLLRGLDIAAVGDNDFYSQRAQLESLGLPRTTKSLSQITPFCHNGVKLTDVHKTGMGSSAALITSLVSALLLHFAAITEADFANLDGDGRRLAHNAAQFVHCFAQGKVGSGFDVSSAVFGSQIYRRFGPAVLEPLMKGEFATGTLKSVLNSSAWDYSFRPIQLPPLTRLVLADVEAGSDTPSLVGKVLKWRGHEDSCETAKDLWTQIDESNQSLARQLDALCQSYVQNKDVYEQTIRQLASLPAQEWESISKAFYDLHQTTQRIRNLMRRMGDLAGVEIEPEQQTHLLDQSIEQAGVVGGGVPGAGGYDAIWLLICSPPNLPDEQQPLRRVETVWSTFNESNVTPLLAQESVAKGARVVQLDEIPGLREAIQRR
ncbi:ribosomal protein S5 domain 2-type protein [Suillus subalutaceus]|uniref:ribosomal protein S5 domain 2-type protein n=1 Tax=Suillus subalutaceus TaxID=48586 RepID=UPI001B87A5EB|nr:ribosomal protein S5 domain 2-type protein [Suillus subalutaceus]KAG1878118.1 ribosomal protein S5 domain 2-type protein [Suillus subalutaceus]